MTSQHFRRAPYRTALVVATALYWLGAAAQEPLTDEATTSAPAFELDRITVIAGKAPRPLEDVANTVTVIDRQRLERSIAQDIAGAIRYEPGVSVDRDAARFGIGGFNIRGIDANRVAAELDGVPVADGFKIGNFSDAGRNFVDVELLERVEILRGPASAIYGSDALGGVVAYTTRDPEHFMRGRAFGATLKSTWSAADDALALTGVLAGGGRRLSGMLAWTARDGHELDNALTAPNPQQFSGDSVLAKLVHDGAGGDHLELTFDTSQLDVDTDVRSLIAGPGRFATTTALFGDDTQDRSRISLEHSLLPAGRWADDVVWRVYHQRSGVEQRTSQELAADASNPSPTRRDRVFDFEQRTTGAELTAAKTLSGARVTHRLVYGAELARTRTLEQRDGLLTYLDDGRTSNVIIGEVFPLRDFPVTDTFDAGIYLQDEIALTDALTLIPALRWERYALDPRPDEVFREDNPDTAVSELSESSLSPKLGLLYRPGPRSTLFAQYAHGFRSPPFEDVNIGFTILQFGFTAIPNPQLEPERSDGVELGWRYRGVHGESSLALYYNRYRNLIESRVNLGVDPATGLLTFQSQNRDRAEIYGAEWRSRIALDAWWPAVEGLGLSASLAWMRGDDTERDQPLNSIDPAQAVIGVDYARPGGRWGVELVTSLVAAKDRVDQSAGTLFTAPGYGLVDLLGYLRLGDRTALRWGLFNLTDKAHWHWADVRGLPAEDPSLALFARPGRHVSLSLSYSFN